MANGNKRDYKRGQAWFRMAKEHFLRNPKDACPEWH
jgi:hypothetical protein